MRAVPLPLRPTLADYVARYPLLGPAEQLPSDLIVNEYYARSHYGDRPAHAEYLEAYGVDIPTWRNSFRRSTREWLPWNRFRSDLVAEDESPLGAAVQHFGEYDLLEKLGEGGMGVVYKAQHRRMKRFVAVKMIARREIGSPDAERRFYREVEAAAKLNHSNIVQAYDASEHDGMHYLVMEYVEGKDLAAHRQGEWTIADCPGGGLRHPGRPRAPVCPRAGHCPPRHQAQQPAAAIPLAFRERGRSEAYSPSSGEGQGVRAS